MQKFQRFMMGRYGVDQFSIFLLIAGLVFTIFGRLFWPLVFLGDLLYFYALFRLLSRNIMARQKELSGFLSVWNPVKNWFQFQSMRFSQRKQYKYFKCPNCKQQLRAPRGRGHIEVTCQKCHQVFRTKT